VATHKSLPDDGISVYQNRNPTRITIRRDELAVVLDPSQTSILSLVRGSIITKLHATDNSRVIAGNCRHFRRHRDTACYSS